jgi:hypothetical protein
MTTTWHRCKPRDPDDALIDELLALYDRARYIEGHLKLIRLAIEKAGASLSPGPDTSPARE